MGMLVIHCRYKLLPVTFIPFSLMPFFGELYFNT